MLTPKLCRSRRFYFFLDLSRYCMDVLSCDLVFFFFFSSRRRHTRCGRDWSSDVCSSDLTAAVPPARAPAPRRRVAGGRAGGSAAVRAAVHLSGQRGGALSGKAAVVPG